MAAYARQAVSRSGGTGWTVSTNTAVLAATISFPPATTGPATVTFFGVGLQSAGATELVFFGAVTPNIVVDNGVTPKLDTGTIITQETGGGDGMTTVAANAFLLLFFNNTAWANVGDAGGLPISVGAGSLFLSLHTGAGPGEGDVQNVNEISYS